MNNQPKNQVTRREFLVLSGLATLATGAGLSVAVPRTALAQGRAMAGPASGGPYNILMIVTDQEHRLLSSELPSGYRLPGHERTLTRHFFIGIHAAL